MLSVALRPDTVNPECVHGVQNRPNAFEINRRVLASDLSHAAKNVLLVILDHARHGESTCTASTRTIARESGMTARHVSRLLPALESAGWIQVERATGSRQSRHTIFLAPMELKNVHVHDNDAQLDPHEVVNLRSCPYDLYLKTEHWRRIRAETLDRFGNRCALCNETHQLDVHHRTYERRGEEQPGDTIVLCRKCHSTFHAKGEETTP